MTNRAVIDELERIRLADPEHKLRAEAVVDAARPLTNILHGKFEWDDGKAAEKYRVHQARQLIRVTVTTLPGDEREIRAYCSLSADRQSKDEDGRAGGYRLTVDVMNDAELQAVLLADALDELKVFEARFGRLRSLAGLFAEYRRLREEEAKKTKKTKKTKRRGKRKKTNRREPARTGRRK